MNYWQKRALEREENLFLQSQEVIEKVKKSYYRINQNIKKEIEVLQNKLDNLENATVSDVEAYNFRKNLLKDLEKKIIEEYSSIAKEEIKETEKFYKSTIKNTYNQISEDLRSVNVGTSFSLLKTEDIEEILKTKWLGSNYSRRVWSNTTILANELSNIILDGITSGRTLKEMSEDLERIMKVGAYSAERLIRTEFNYFSNQSSIRAYKDYGIDKYQFLAAIDNRTSELCIEMHEKVFYVKDVQVGKNYPPLHPFCRSTTIAYFDELQQEDKESIIIYKESKSIKEAEDYARDILKVKSVSYKGCDLKTANEWNKGLCDNFRRFPELKEKFNFVGECYERNKLIKLETKEYYMSILKEKYPYAKTEELEKMATKEVKKLMKNLTIGKSTYAESWSPNHSFFDRYKGITVNKHWGKNSNEFIKVLKNDVEAKFHPIGCDTIRSVLDHEIGHQIDDLLGISNLKQIQELFDRYTNEQLTEHISQYSWDNNNPNKYSEFIAEGWAEYCNNSNPREIAKTIGEIIEKEYKKWKKK